MIAEWLVETYKGDFHITTILYLHRITDNRMAGSAAKNLRLFVDLCGKKAMPNVVIVTTMWSEVNNVADAEKREVELMSDFWKDLLAGGCKVIRFEETPESAWGIMDSVVEKNAADLLLPKQIVDYKLRLNETDVGISLRKELEKLVEDRKKMSRELRIQARRQDNQAMVQDLNREQEEIDVKIRSILAQLKELKIPITRKIFNFLTFRWLS